MITMLHYDALQNPTQPNRKGATTSLGQAQAYLEQHPYNAFEENDLVDVCLKCCTSSFYVVKALLC